MQAEKTIHSWILNHKGLTVYSTVPDKLINIKYDEEDYSWNDLLLDVFAKYSGSPDSESPGLTTIPLPASYQFVQDSSIYYSRNESDLYVIAATVETSLQEMEDELSLLIKLRRSMKERFVGMLFSDFLDLQGPVPVYNNSPLDETMTYQLAAQGMSLAAMGQDELPKHIIGPIPVPGSKVYQALAYSFTRPVDDSDDPRIQAGGRPGTLFLIFTLEKLEKDVLEFVEAFLMQWRQSPDVTPDGIEYLLENLRLTITLAWDLIKYRARQNDYLREKVTQYYSELILLRQENLKLCMELRKIKQQESSDE